jgi:hypothetical protein
LALSELRADIKGIKADVKIPKRARMDSMGMMASISTPGYEIEGLKADMKYVRHEIGEMKLATTDPRESTK